MNNSQRDHLLVLAMSDLKELRNGCPQGHTKLPQIVTKTFSIISLARAIQMRGFGHEREFRIQAESKFN